MRLLVLAQGYPSPANPMAGIFHRNQMAALSGLGCEITFVAPTPWVPPGLADRHPRWRSYADMPRRQTDGAVTVLRPRYLTVPRENCWGLSHLTQGWAVRSLNLPKPDLIHAFYALPTGLLARSLAERWQIPYMVSLLGDDVTIYPHQNSGAMARFRRSLQGASAVVANGDSLGRLAEQLASVSIESLSLGVDFRRFQNLPSKDVARSQLGLPQEATIALFAGNLYEAKGMVEWDAALRRLNRPGLLALCVGDGPERSRLESNPSVRCEGAQPGERIPLYMRAADLLVLPSHREGLPTVVIEAGAAGLPVVGSDIPGIVDLLGENRGFIHKAKDVGSLAAALEEALANPDETFRRASALTTLVHRRHDVVGNCRRLMETYRRVLGR